MIRGGNIGAMDVILVIQEPVKSYDSVTNEQTEPSWNTFATVWAQKMTPPASVEKFEGDQTVALQRYTFKIRYIAGLTEEMRMMRGTEANYITGIDEIDRKTFLEVTTEKRDNDGATVTVEALGTDITFQDEGIDL